MADAARMLTPDDVVSRAQGLLSAQIDGDTVLMSVEHGSYFGLSATAGDVWRRLETPMSVADLCRILGAAYDGDQQAIEADILSFLNQLLAKGLIRTE